MISIAQWQDKQRITWNFEVSMQQLAEKYGMLAEDGDS